MSDKSEIIAGSLRAHRAKNRVTQSQIADAANAGKSTVVNWEDKGCIPLKEAWALADFYNVSLDELAGRVRESV